MKNVDGWVAPRLRPVLALAGWYLVLQTVLRVVLWAAFGRQTGVGAWQLSWVLPAGVFSDCVESLYLLLPWALLLWLVPERWYTARWFRVLVFVAVFVWLSFLTFAAIAEYYFFDEFNARFNLVSVDYLIYPTEVVGDIRDEYPLKTVAIIVLAVAVFSLWWLRRSLTPLAQPGYGWKQRGRLFVAYAVLLIVALAGFTSDTFGFSGNRVTNELAANGASSFFRALRTSDIDYNAFYATRDPKQNLAVLSQQLAKGGGEFTRLAEGRLDRRFPARSDGFGKLNVVVLASESFGAEFSKLYGSERDWTPQFDAFAQQGLWFRNMYASGTRTVRGLEAITSSFPPIPSDSIVRRPGNENIATWGKVMRGEGYQTSFLYGGYGYFDNMNAYYASNGFEVRDRNAIKGKLRFGNVWGVSDEDLYDMALAYYDQQNADGKPFFSIIMNTSNHKPYTFREGVPGVKAQHGGRESGVRYADFATGYLLREAAKHKWFDDTIFVVVADHGARVYGRADIPLKSYEIPLLIYSPKHIKPGVVESLTGQIDIAPTVLGMLGFAYTAPFFGQDALHTPDADRIALFSHNHDVALLKGDKLAILGLQSALQTLQYDKVHERYTALPHDAELENLAIAYYQTAFEQFRNHTYE